MSSSKFAKDSSFLRFVFSINIFSSSLALSEYLSFDFNNVFSQEDLNVLLNEKENGLEVAADGSTKIEVKQNEFNSRVDNLNTFLNNELTKLKSIYSEEKESLKNFSYEQENDQKLFNFIKNNNFEYSNIPPNVLVNLIKHLINEYTTDPDSVINKILNN